MQGDTVGVCGQVTAMPRRGRCVLSVALTASLMFATAPGYGQGSGPHTDTLSEDQPTGEDLREAVKFATQMTIDEIRKLGGGAALRADLLATLPPHRLIERLSVDPVVGPSTIAAPPSGVSVPFPSVNWVGDQGGTTTGHAGVALLLAKRSGQDTFKVHCSGTLIRQNLVLTAAHCVCHSRQPAANYPTGELCAHGTDLTAPSALMDPARWRVFLQHAGIRRVERIEINEHYQFGESAVRNDIAILVLSRPVTQIVPPILAMPSAQPSTWQSGTIVGFGYSANPGLRTASFLELVLPGLKAQGLVTSDTCSSLSYLDPDAALCSSFELDNANHAATSCGGDSGGPLWEAGERDTEIGIASGRNNEDCSVLGTLAFQMSIAYRAHWDWINQRVAALGSSTQAGRWPVFGENLRHVIDRRNFQLFDTAGAYASDGWMVTSETDQLVLGTMNSSGKLTRFALEDRAGVTLCEGLAGPAEKMPNVDYCSAKISPGQQFRVVANGGRNELLQYVVTTHASGTSFAP